MNQQGLQDLLTYQFQSYFINIGKRRMIDEINFEFKQELHKRRRNRQNTNCSEKPFSKDLSKFNIEDK